MYVDESTGSRYGPCSVLMHLVLGAMNSVRAGPYGRLFHPDNFVF